MKENIIKRNYYIETFGCQMNEHDSEAIEGILTQENYSKVYNKEDANIIIYNTCCVRENAELKLLGKIGALKKLKEKKKDLIIGICGCMMQQKSVQEKIKKKYKHVDLVFGTHNLHELPNLLNDIKKKNRIIDVWEKEGEIVEELPFIRKFKIKSFVNIMYGCNNFCTYCIVPYTRGRERSREAENIINEIKALEKDGVIEVTLLGQNVNSYGKTFNENYDFADLIKDIEKNTNIKRLRFMTSHPKDISDKLINTFKDSKILCNHIHLPVQSGSTRVLKEMNRGYTKEDYLSIIEKVKKLDKNIAITTDIIVGFPGETEEDFEDTLDIVKKVEFDSAFYFLYSIREGTPAEKYENQIPEEIKKERFNRLKKLVDETSKNKNKMYLNNIEEVLVEGKSSKNDEIFTGKTSSYKTVNIKCKESSVNKLIKVKITDVKSFSLNGEEIN